MKSSVAAPVFLGTVVIAAVLSEHGTEPVKRDEFIMWTRRGHRAGRQFLTSGVGIGSRRQVVDLALVAKSWTKCSSTSSKAEKRLSW